MDRIAERVGRDPSEVRRLNMIESDAFPYDTGLSILFRDRAALDSYATNPRHIPVAQLGRDLSDSIVAVDFEA